MRHELNRVPQFYVTAPQKCPYIKGKIERKLFTALYGRNTVNLNDDLESTILSVKFQKYRNLIEHIIIDGGSRNVYLKLLNHYSKDIDYWISEKDRGIWDASNKGITLE